jgi:hypothetical protein
MPLAAKTTLRNELPYEVSAFARLVRGWAVADLGASAALIIAPLGKAAELVSLARAGESVAVTDAVGTIWKVVSRGEKITRKTISQISKKGTPVRSQETVEIYKVGVFQRLTTPSGLFGEMGFETELIEVVDGSRGRIAAFHAKPGSDWTIDDRGVGSEESDDRYSWVVGSG